MKAALFVLLTWNGYQRIVKLSCITLKNIHLLFSTLITNYSALGLREKFLFYMAQIYYTNIVIWTEM